jgi:predicted amidophosphoribosyltransferase
LSARALRSSRLVEEEDELPKPSPLQEKECPRCHSKNTGTYEFCGLCGRPFDEKVVVEEELEEQKLKNEVEVLRKEVQKTEGVGEYLDYLQTQIEQLQKQLAALKNGGKYPEVS